MTRMEASNRADSKNGQWRVSALLALLLADVVVSGILNTPWINGIERSEGVTHSYTFGGSVVDLFILAILRVVLALAAFLVSYFRGEIRPEYTFDVYQQNGIKKTREELEEEALEQSFFSWLRRFLLRPVFSCEFVALVTMVMCIVKCLVRLNIEIGKEADENSSHPLLWCAILFSCVVALLEITYVDAVSVLFGEWGNARRVRSNSTSTLSEPLLEPVSPQDEEEATAGTSTNEAPQPVDDDAPGVSDIGGDASYKASLGELLAFCIPDMHLIFVAFVFLLLAAGAQIYIPKYTGKIFDDLGQACSGDVDDGGDHGPISDVHGLMSHVKKLITVSILGGVFSGIRGSIFTVVGGRVSARLRLRLLDSMLVQDIGFFDTTKTGDITSRLSNDTSLVGDQVTLNVNVFLRSLVQAIGVLIFMFMLSWQLSILAFISVPAITILSKWYGSFVRSLTKVMLNKLAAGNSIAEAAISSMPTVRTFDAAPAERREFEEHLEKYLSLNFKLAIAYSGYATCTTSLPQLVTALVVFYGGLLVRNGDLSGGDLLSFFLYLSSLSDAFSSIGYIYSSLTQAVGAADKVFELMNRKPNLRPPASTPPVPASGRHRLRANSNGGQTALARIAGSEPDSCRGEIVLENVQMYYPSRPRRRVLNDISLVVPPGKIAALVGQSGGGKSSVVSLVQHLYEQSAGKVMIDGNEVHDLSPRWLSRHISIVSQEPTLFARSIRRNIMYGLEGTEHEPSQEEIERVAKLANAHSFIERMPQKYETEVGERGVQLSGGQKQRIAIARALVRKPKILLLDEATSALDAESEHHVQEAIDHMLAAGREQDGGAGMTVLVVAHRLSTIRNADVIFVVQEGRVVEQGNHADLIENPDGAYASLIKRQMEAQKKLATGDS